MSNRMTWDECAARVGMNVRTLYALRAQGGPAVPSPAQWRKYLAEREGASGLAPGAPESEAVLSLRERKLAQEVRKLEIMNDMRDARKLALWKQAGREEGLAVVNQARQGLYGLVPDRVAAKTGCDAVILRKELEAAIDEVFPKEDPANGPG